MYAMATSFIAEDADDEYMKWLKKSAEAGYAQAQYQLAEAYKAGDGWFLIPGSRDKEVRRLYQASAEQEYIPAISKYASILAKEGKPKEAVHFLDITIDKGAAIFLLHIGKMYEEGDIPKVLGVAGR